MGRKRRRDNIFNSAMLNEECYQHYYTRLFNLALSRFEWKNLPETIDPRFLEQCLLNDGYCLFFKDEVLGYLALQCMIGGKLDVYRIPIQRNAYATNGYHKQCNSNDSVIIYNDLMHNNGLKPLHHYALRLYEIQRTIDVNVNAQKTPVMVLCNENQRLTMKNLYMQYEGNEPFIFGDKDLDVKGIEVLHTNAPYVADNLQLLKTNIWNEALNTLGISSSNSLKKERLLKEEVKQSMGDTYASRFSALASRQNACEQINRMFGLNISVDYRKDSDEMLDDEMIDDETKEGVENE